MPEQDYEYRGLMAQSWDLFRGDTSNWEDKFFFRDIISQYGQPVLDVGCGTGRLILDFLAEGLDVDGVDNSPEMLALCRQKGAETGLQPTLFQREMEALDLPRKYKTIIVSSSSFQLVTDTELAAQTMACFNQHLLKNGVLVMPFMIFGRENEIIETDWDITAEATRPEDGALIRRWSWAKYDGLTQLQHTKDRYEVSLDDEVIASEEHQRSPAVRWYTQKQAMQLYQTAGFGNITLLKGFTQEPASKEDRLFSVLGTKL